MNRTSVTDGHSVNMTGIERILSLASGALLVTYGLRRRDKLGVAAAILGGTVAWCGYQGHSGLYESLGVQRFSGARGRNNVIRGQGIHVERAVTIQAPIDEVFDHWRQFENLPHFMRHLVEVRPIGGRRYHWTARAPMGKTVEWDAEITSEHRPHFLTWQSLPGSDIENAGSVYFSQAPFDRGTEVRVILAYKPPAGPLGALVARLLGEEPSSQIRDDLGRLKQIMETGEVATAAPRPFGR